MSWNPIQANDRLPLPDLPWSLFKVPADEGGQALLKELEEKIGPLDDDYKVLQAVLDCTRMTCYICVCTSCINVVSCPVYYIYFIRVNLNYNNENNIYIYIYIYMYVYIIHIYIYISLARSKGS